MLLLISLSILFVSCNKDEDSITKFDEIYLKQYIVEIGVEESFNIEVDQIIPENTSLDNIIWSSSNESIATVDKKGRVTGKKLGKVEIYASSVDDKESPKSLVEVNVTEFIKFTDSKFEDAILNSSINSIVRDNRISVDEALYDGNLDIYMLELTDASDLKFFPKITNLRIDQNDLTSLDLSNNTELIEVSFNDNNISNLNLGNITKLQDLNASRNKLTNIDLSKNYDLRFVLLDNNNISNIDLSKNLRLRGIFIDNNKLTNLNLSNNNGLRQISCSNNELETLLLPSARITESTSLHCDNNNLTTLDVTSLSHLYIIKCNNNNLEELDLSHISSYTGNDLSRRHGLEEADCSYNQLKSLKLPSGVYFNASINCSHNQLSELDFPEILS